MIRDIDSGIPICYIPKNRATVPGYFSLIEEFRQLQFCSTCMRYQATYHTSNVTIAVVKEMFPK